MFKNLLVRAGVGVLGIAVMLAWWSFHGGSSNTATVEKIPAKVWNGGAGTLTVEVEASCPAKMSINFEEREGEVGSRRNLQTWEQVGPGSHSWTIDVPSRVGGYIELGAVEPKVGDTLTWRIKLNGQVVDEQTEALQEALKPGYAFFLQSYFEDYATATKEEDD